MFNLSAFTNYWNDYYGLSGYTLFETTERLTSNYTNHYTNIYLNNGNLHTTNSFPQINNNNYLFNGGATIGFLGKTNNFKLSTVQLFNLFSTYEDNNSYAYSLSFTNVGLKENRIGFNTPSSNEITNLWSGEVSNDNLSYLTAFNKKNKYERTAITYATKHNNTGHILQVEQTTGKVYFLVPDSTNPTGYKSFTIIHGWYNKYPFECTRWPVSNSYTNAPGNINAFTNSFYGCSPVKCYFHDSTTFSVLYAAEVLPTDHERMGTSLKTSRFVTFKINSLNFNDGDSNLTDIHKTYNKNIFLNGHNIYDSPNLVLQPYPKRYIIAAGSSETVQYEGRTYYKDGYSKYPITFNTPLVAQLPSISGYSIIPGYFNGVRDPSFDYIYTVPGVSVLSATKTVWTNLTLNK
jgi:hypothetical protein